MLFLFFSLSYSHYDSSVQFGTSYLPPPLPLFDGGERKKEWGFFEYCVLKIDSNPDIGRCCIIISRKKHYFDGGGKMTESLH